MASPTVNENSRGNVEHVFHDLFQNFSEWNPENRRSYVPDVTDACKAQIVIHENAMRDIEDAEHKVDEVEAKRLERLMKIRNNARAVELMRLRRQPLCTNLNDDVAKKYALLESSDLWSNNGEDFRTNEMSRSTWKRSPSSASKDIIFEVPEQNSVPDEKTRNRENNRRKGRKVKSDYSIARDAARLRTPWKSIMRTQTRMIVLVAEPNRVKFHNFEPRKIYRKFVSMKNVSSNTVAKFHMEPRSSSSKFSIVFDSPLGDRRNLAPGMNVKMMISFSSDNGDDAEERIVFKVQFGEPVIVAVNACRDPPILKGTIIRSTNCNAKKFDECIFSNIENCKLVGESSEDSWDNFANNEGSWSSETFESNYVYVRRKELATCAPVPFAPLDCKKCFVGEKIVVTTRLKNVGGDGRFFTMSEFDWNSMSIDDITTDNKIILPRFSIRPAYFALKRNEEVDLLTHFFPDSRGVQVDKLYIACDNLALHPVELLGDGVLYDPGIVTLNNLVERNYGRQNKNKENCFELTINMGFGVPNDILEKSIAVSNTSDLEIHYRWTTGLTKFGETRSEAQTWKDLPCDFLSISPSGGFFQPCSSVTFAIATALTDLTTDIYRGVLQLYLEDIPAAAIPPEFAGRTEISRNNRRLCELSMDILDKEIELWVRCTASSYSEPFSYVESSETFEYRSEQHSDD